MQFRSIVADMKPGSLSPTNVDQDAYFCQDMFMDIPAKFVESSHCGNSTSTTSIAAIAKEFQDAKIFEIKALIEKKVPLVLVTTKSWECATLMYDGLHFVYEGYLLNVQGDGACRQFTMRLDYPKRKSPICVQFTTSDVVSLLPRHGQRSKSEECSYFHMHCHCAFGLNCHKAHNPWKLNEKVKERLRSRDISIINENQQHTLHIAMVEEGITELEMRAHFEPFGPLKSVKIEPGKTLLPGQAWRIGFVTFQKAKDAIKAKKFLNEDPKSKFRGLVQFSKQPTKNHSSSGYNAVSSPSFEISLPRQNSLPRWDRPTEQIYLHRTQRHIPTTPQDIKQLLEGSGISSYIDITVSPKADYGLVLFDCIQNGMFALHTLLESQQGEWILDYQPVEDHLHLKLRYHRWRVLKSEESNLMSIINNYWDAWNHEDEDFFQEINLLHHELKNVKSELLDADEALSKLVFQAARQAFTQVQKDHTYLNILQLGSAIGPEAVAFTEEKMGGLRDFIDGQKPGLLMKEDDHIPPFPSVSQPLLSSSIKTEIPNFGNRDVPHMYTGLFDHVAESQQIYGDFSKDFWMKILHC